MSHQLTSCGHELDMSPKRFGELKDSGEFATDPEVLRARMKEDGYLLLRGFLDKDEVLKAREEVFNKWSEVGEIDTNHPIIDGISSGTSKKNELEDPGLFRKHVCEGPNLRKVTHSGPMIEFYERFLGGPVRCFDYLWLRTVAVGNFTPPHYDIIYMGRGTKNLYTSWTPLGDVPRTDGSLLVLENSHTIKELLDHYASIDFMKPKHLTNKQRTFRLNGNPAEVAEKYDRRWLTTDFQAGDLLLFGMFTMHCSLDNRSTVNRLRLSSDTRYQLASDPVDERWIGPNPIAHGHGYGENRSPETSPASSS